MNSQDISISAVSTYLPTAVMTAREIEEKSTLPEAVLVEKFGLREKHIAGDDEHVSTMSVAALQPLRSGMDAGPPPGSLIYFGSSVKDYQLWSCAVAIQQSLGLDSTYAFEVGSNCAGFAVALQVGRALLLTDPLMTEVWLVGASKDASVVDYSDMSAKSVFLFGDGAAAVVLRRGAPGISILSNVVRSDGRHNESFLIPGGGTRVPASETTLRDGMHMVRVKAGLRPRTDLEPDYLRSIIDVGEEALRQAGLSGSSIDLLVLQHQPPHITTALIEGLGLGAVDTVDLGDVGHMSSVDLPLALQRALDEGKLTEGKHALLLAAGVGYTWTGTVLRMDGPVATYQAERREETTQ